MCDHQYSVHIFSACVCASVALRTDVQQLNIVIYVSACKGKIHLFIACSELKVDRKPCHAICLINGSHHQYYGFWQITSECGCEGVYVCLRLEFVPNLRVHVCLMAYDEKQ